MATYEIVESTTDVLQFQLVENGTPINLGSLTVSLLLEDRTGTAIASPGTVTVIDSTNGKVQLTPTNSSVFVAANGPYFARWVLMTAGGANSYVPTTARDMWSIVGL